MDLILIEGFRVDAVVGCFSWEREMLQPLMLDLQVFVDLSKAAKSDDLDDTINYAKVCELTTEVIQLAKPKLIENAAQIVIDTLFDNFAEIQRLSITIRKPAIIPQAQSVGVRLERERICTRDSQ